jgi:NADPH:quinone reductase
MQAAVCHEYGPPESLRVEEVPQPVPGAREVLVQIAFAALNFPDLLIIANKYQVSIPTPFIPGSEFAGVVTAIGSDVTNVAVGDRVFGSSFSGSFATHTVVPAQALRAVPDGVGLDAAAAFWVGHATSYHAVRSVAEVTAGDTVVVLGAAGGVGLAAVEIAKLLGATVIAAASSDERLELCRQRGADYVINYDTTDLRDAIKEIEPDGVDVVIDPIGGPYAERALRATRWGGRFVTVGFASGEIPRIPLNLVLLKGVIIKGFEIRTFAQYAPEQAKRDVVELTEHLAAGRLVPHISSVYPLAQVTDALHEVASRRSTGKVLLRP